MEGGVWMETRGWWDVWVGVSPVQEPGVGWGGGGDHGGPCEINPVASGRQRVSWAGRAESGVLGGPDGGTTAALEGKPFLPATGVVLLCLQGEVSKYSAWLSCLILERRHVCASCPGRGGSPGAQGEL